MPVNWPFLAGPLARGRPRPAATRRVSCLTCRQRAGGALRRSVSPPVPLLCPAPQYAYMGRPQSFWDWFFRDFGKPGATSEDSGAWSGGLHALPAPWAGSVRGRPSRGAGRHRRQHLRPCVAPDPCLACLALLCRACPLLRLPKLVPRHSAGSGGARRTDFLPHADEVWWRAEPDGGLTLVVKAGFDLEAVEKAGAPQALWTEIRRARAARPDWRWGCYRQPTRGSRRSAVWRRRSHCLRLRPRLTGASEVCPPAGSPRVHASCPWT